MISFDRLLITIYHVIHPSMFFILIFTICILNYWFSIFVNDYLLIGYWLVLDIGITALITRLIAYITDWLCSLITWFHFIRIWLLVASDYLLITNYFFSWLIIDYSLTIDIIWSIIYDYGIHSMDWWLISIIWWLIIYHSIDCICYIWLVFE